MNNKWNIDNLFMDENNGNPFQRDQEEMLIWESDGQNAYTVWRGYDKDIAQTIILSMQQQNPNMTYHVEFPGRKGHRDSKPIERREFTGGAKCLPNAKQKMLISLIENRWGATLNEHEYMKTHGKHLAFYMRSDKSRETIFDFSNWNDVRQMAYMKK